MFYLSDTVRYKTQRIEEESTEAVDDVTCQNVTCHCDEVIEQKNLMWRGLQWFANLGYSLVRR